MSIDNPHEVALSVLDDAITDRINRRTDCQFDGQYDKLSSEIGQLRTTRRMIVDGSIRVPHPVPEWFRQFADQLANMERRLTEPKPAEVGPVNLTVTHQRDLPGFIRRDEFGTLVMDYASGAVVPVNRLHIGKVDSYGRGGGDAVIYNYDPQRRTTPVRMLNESAAYLRSTTVIVPDSMTEIPLPK